MSCYEWEHGTIIIPKGQWPKFRRGLLVLWNEAEVAAWVDAKACHAKAKAACKGKRGKSRSAVALKTVAEHCGGTIDRYGDFDTPTRGGWRTEEDALVEERFYRLRDLVLQSNRDEDGAADWRVRPSAPKKKSFQILQTTKSQTIYLSEADVRFNNDTNSITWSVPENSRACDAARAHWFAEALFSALRDVTWTRKSGGKIVGNDEYNRDGCDEGDGGNYVNDRFGPLGEDPQQRRRR